MHTNLSSAAEIVDIRFLFKTRSLITLAKAPERLATISVFLRKDERLLVTAEIKEDVSKILQLALSHDEFLLHGPRYMRIWHFSENT